MGWFGKSTARELIAQGIALLERQDAEGAYARMRAANEAEPENADSLAWMADIVARDIQRSGRREYGPDYAHADELARGALLRDPHDQRAISVLGRLARLRQGSIQASAQIADSMAPADRAFAARHYAEAQRMYEEIMRASPTLSEPAKRAGNCRFAARDARGAEPFYQLAIEIDPLDTQAHHFLANAFLAQGLTAPAAAAACNAIEANPAYYPAWDLLHELQRTMDQPLARFRIRPGAAASHDKATGRPRVNVFADRVAGNAEAAAWVAYAVTRAGISLEEDAMDGAERDEDAAQPPTPTTEFEAALRAFRAAAAIAADATGLAARERESEGMRVLRKLAEIDAAGALPSAVLLLAYDEAFRGELEAAKRQKPALCRDFVERWKLAPL